MRKDYGDEGQILAREQALRAWFTRDAEPVLAQIDGLDIGWGGVQRWATAQMPPVEGLHLDVACGYATFLAQLGWRFPTARLVGLNIDFDGPHALARPLLTEARITAVLVQADARQMPFADGTFASTSCFLGLQDIEIGFGEEGVRETLTEAIRVLRPDGLLILLDEFSFDRFAALLGGLPVEWIDQGEREPDVQWDREVAQAAIRLYAKGWVAQMCLPRGDEAAHEAAYQEVLGRMEAEVEEQVTRQGYYVPFGPMRTVVVRRRRGVDRCRSAQHWQEGAGDLATPVLGLAGAGLVGHGRPRSTPPHRTTRLFHRPSPAPPTPRDLVGGCDRDPVGRRWRGGAPAFGGRMGHPAGLNCRGAVHPHTGPGVGGMERQ